VARRFGLNADNAPTHPSLITAQRIKESMNRGVRYFAAEVEGRMAGCAGLEQASAEVCYLERLAVLPAHQNRGLGSALIEHAAGEAAWLGAGRLEIGLIAQQDELMAWYRRRGFVLTGTKTFDHLPFTVAFMRRELGRAGSQAGGE